MTVEEKAKQWLDDNFEAYVESDIKSLARLLKEQDRDTRHACADAVMSAKSTLGKFTIIKKSEAHNACMNTKAV